MKKIISFFVLLAFFAGWNIQTANATFTPGYTFTSLSGLTYDTLTTGTKVTTVTTGTADDGSFVITLPWSFKYNGGTFTQVTACTNGWLAMGSNTLTTISGTALFSSTTPNNVIGGWWRDGNLNTANAGMFKHGEIIVGSDTIYVVEFRNQASNGSGSTSATLRYNMEIYLYKTSNKIEIRYGAAGVGISTASSIGIEDDEVGVAPHFYNAVAGGSTTLTTTSSAWVGSGNGYRFSPILPPNCTVTIENLNPTGTLIPGICTPQTLTPQAKITNGGLMDQTSMQVRYQVPSEGYDETVTGINLTAGNNTTVNFPSTLTASGGSPGVKNVTITVDATCDGGSVNYVLNTSYTVSSANYHFGGPTGGYYFANSTSGASCAPNQPIFNWRDTTGSTNLILNGVNVTSPSILSGSVDDGFFRVGNVLPSGDKFRFSGVDYDSFYVGTNGMIAFTRAFNTDAQLTTFQPLAIPSTIAPRPAIFPFWKDFNFGDADVPLNRLCYKYSAGLLIITYSNAPDFPAGATDYTSFQVILETGPSPSSDGVWTVQYNDALSGAGFLSKYFSNTFATALDSHTVGLQNQAGTTAIQYRRVNGLRVAVVPGPLFSSPVAVSFGPNNSALPVELASFTSTANGRDVTLNWTTATETNNSGFDVERSVNGIWSKVGNVSGNGTTTSPVNYTFTDRNLASGKYNYRLKQIDFNGNFEYFNLSSEVNVGIPEKYNLAQNYPNPFNPSTTISYDLPFDSKVSIKLFDMSGREVSSLVNEVKTAGYYSVNFNASNLSSGVYFYRISAEGNGQNFVSTKKMMLVK